MKCDHVLYLDVLNH